MIITTVSGNKVSIDVNKVVNVQESWHDGRRCAYIAMDNKQGFSVFDSVEFLDAQIQKEKGLIADDPADDCTPNQHPAFGRGEQWAVKMMLREINAILDGAFPIGRVSDPDLQRLRERLVAYVSSGQVTTTTSPFTQAEIQTLKHMAVMNMPLGGPRT